MRAASRGRWSLSACAAGLLVLAAGEAQARSEQLRWQHPDPASVSGFKVHIGSAPGTYQTTIDVRLPTPVGGVYSYTLQVPDPNSVYVSVTAYGPTGLESPRSNEQLRPGLLSAPGQPTVAP